MTMHYIRCLTCGDDIPGDEYEVHRIFCQVAHEIKDAIMMQERASSKVIPHEVPSGE